jgi:transcriptional regulator with PAS, ATPase and Fis domain
MDLNWLDGIGAAITVCDFDGIIVYMNAQSVRNFEEHGGKALLGKSIYDCHQEASRVTIRRMLKDLTSNTYTIEKKGIKKLVWQTPWIEQGVCKGLVEAVIPIPFDMPHFVRDKQEG